VNTITPFDASLFRSVLENLPLALYIVDLDRRILLWNEAAEKISGYLAAEVVGRHCSDNILVHCDSQGAVLCGDSCPLAETMRDGRQRETKVFLRHRGGHRVPVFVRAVPLRQPNGVLVGAVEVFETTEAPPEQGGSVDEPDPSRKSERGGFDRLSIEALLRARFRDFVRHKPFAVLLIRIENAGQVAGMYGWPAIDGMTEAVSRTATSSLRRTDHIGRWARDRLLAVMPNCPEWQLPKITERLQDLLAQTSVLWWGERLSITLSVGAASVREGDTPESLVARCEEALGSLERTS